MLHMENYSKFDGGIKDRARVIPGQPNVNFPRNVL